MKLPEAEAMARLIATDHGVFCTVHARRGVDAVPCVYAVDEDGCLGIPLDRVKPKTTGPLQRERNLHADPRATLLVEHWDREDWSRLWWVRVELRALPEDPKRSAALARRLSARYPQYRAVGSIAQVLQLEILAVSGWSGERL